jgi:hypothetical protein
MSTDTEVVTVHIPRDLAQRLCDDAEILIHEDQVEGVPEGVLYDTVADRWTWEIDEAVLWAIERLAAEDERELAPENAVADGRGGWVVSTEHGPAAKS